MRISSVPRHMRLLWVLLYLSADSLLTLKKYMYYSMPLMMEEGGTTKRGITKRVKSLSYLNYKHDYLISKVSNKKCSINSAKITVLIIAAVFCVLTIGAYFIQAAGGKCEEGALPAEIGVFLWVVINGQAVFILLRLLYRW